MIDRPTRLALLLPLLLYVVLWFCAARWLGPSGDAVSVWGSPAPLRTVLCVQDGPSLTLAAAPDGPLDASLQTAEVVQGGALGVAHRDHAYRASLRAFGAEAPWMKNEYAAGFPEWLPHLAFRLTGSLQAGRLTTMALGALVLLLVGLCAARIGGWPAAAVAGSLLAVEPMFHVWKKILAGPEVWLQLCSAFAAWCVLRAIQEQAPRRLLPAALAVGVGLHVKPTFAAFAVPLALLSLPLLPWSSLGKRGWAKVLAAATALVLIGSLPTTLYLTSRPAASQGNQESAAGRLADVVHRWKRPDRPIRDESLPRKEVALGTGLLLPGSWLADYWAIRAMRDNDPRTDDRLERDRPPIAVVVGARALVFLAGLAVWGAVRRRGAVAWAVALGVCVPLATRAMHPDPHHLGLALPAIALALGAGAGALWRSPRARWVVAVALVATLAGRGTDLLRLDEAFDARAGRILDVRAWTELGRALEEEGAVAPAALDYEALGLGELFTGGRVRPYLYARASARGCLKYGSDAWLGAVLSAHAGGHVLSTWGTEGMPTLAGQTSWVAPERLGAIARRQGQSIRAVREVLDAQGRWTATIYAVSPRPP